MIKELAEKEQYLSRRTFLTGAAKLGLASTGLLLATTAGSIIPVSAAGASQDRWYHCWKCGSLFWAGRSGKACPAGGEHDLTNSWNFVLVTSDYPISGQDNWRHCWKCGMLFWAGRSGKACPAGGEHDPTNSWNFLLATEWSKISGGQDNWRHCWKCGTLFWAGLKGTVCPTGGAHDPTNSWNFVLTTTPPTVISTPPHNAQLTLTVNPTELIPNTLRITGATWTVTPEWDPSRAVTKDGTTVTISLTDPPNGGARIKVSLRTIVELSGWIGDFYFPYQKFGGVMSPDPTYLFWKGQNLTAGWLASWGYANDQTNAQIYVTEQYVGADTAQGIITQLSVPM